MSKTHQFGGLSTTKHERLRARLREQYDQTTDRVNDFFATKFFGPSAHRIGIGLLIGWLLAMAAVWLGGMYR